MIILSCPSCGSNEMVQNGSKITCKECGSVFAMIKKAETAQPSAGDAGSRLPENPYERVPEKKESIPAPPASRVPEKKESFSEDLFDLDSILNDPDITGKFDYSEPSPNPRRKTETDGRRPYQSRDAYRNSAESSPYTWPSEQEEAAPAYSTGKHESPKSSSSGRDTYIEGTDKSSGHIKSSDFNFDDFNYDPKSRKKISPREEQPTGRRERSASAPEEAAKRPAREQSYRTAPASRDDFSAEEYRRDNPDPDLSGKYLKAGLICLVIAMVITLVLGFLTDFQFIFLVLIIGLCTGGLGFVGWLLIFHTKSGSSRKTE